LKNETTLTFKFKDEEFYPMTRSQQFTLKDFLSYAGGLLGMRTVQPLIVSSFKCKSFEGLFMGVSVLSIVELVYFFTMRLGTNFLRALRT
jgi:hypothetical protein